ncbi:short-chain dehydrogenase [Paractinoplanes brasiliensis]|nr:short-chain dehydrogenase [Actinoplanes brasiliensis]
MLVGRSPAKTRAVAEELGADHFIADFARLEEVRALAADLIARYPRIDVLANNAGGVIGKQHRTVDGFERTFQVNHLAPFWLTHLMLDTLIASRASVIQTASTGARIAGKLVLDDLEHQRDFTPERAYSTAKLYNILFTKELHRRYHDQGIAAAAFHPGVVATSFATEAQSWLRHVYRLTRPVLIGPEKGAAQLIWLAAGEPGRDWQSGTYYEKKRPARRNNPQALDPALARELWDRTAALLASKQG